MVLCELWKIGISERKKPHQNKKRKRNQAQISKITTTTIRSKGCGKVGCWGNLKQPAEAAVKNINLLCESWKMYQ